MAFQLTGSFGKLVSTPYQSWKLRALVELPTFQIPGYSILATCQRGDFGNSNAEFLVS